MENIIPRWEWRSFGRNFGKAEAQLATLKQDGVQETDEIYLLSGEGDNVKVRADLMDIKILKQVNSDGLEQWTPVMKAGFPLSAADVGKVFASLRLPVPTLARASYTLDEFIQDFAKPGAAIRKVQVHKRRVRYTVGGCTSEISDVVVDGKATRTLAIESSDAEAVIDAVRSLGLGGYSNTSYPRALAASVNNKPERYAVIDAGTNSIKFHVGERDSKGLWRTVVDRAELTRLGEGLAEQGVISDAALERTVVAIQGMLQDIKQLGGVRAIAAVGTAGLRSARNGKDIVAAIAKRTGVTIEIISGDEETRLAYLAAKAGLGLKTGSLVVFDTGGGSSQFTFGHDAQVDDRFSVDVGAVRYTERFKLDGVVTPEVLKQAMAAIAADLASIDGRQSPDILVAMGGAVTNITAVKHAMVTYDAARVQGTVLDRAEIDRQIALYTSRDANARRSIVGLQPKRAEVILAGACIVRTVMEKLGAKSLTVSDRGLRHGVLAERFDSDDNAVAVTKAAKKTTKISAKTSVKKATKQAAKKVAKKATKKATKRPAKKLAKTAGNVVLLSSDEKLRALNLSRGSNSIELKLTVPASGHRATIKSLKLDPVEAEPRQAFFFDTPKLELFKAGVVVRARRIQGGRADTVIKLRPIDPEHLDDDARRSEGFKVELDVMPGGYVCSASFKGVCTGKEVLEMSAGKRKLSSLFSKAQRAFFAEHAPAHIKLDNLQIMGPVFLLRSKHKPKEFDRGVTVEMWLYPDGSRVLEVSAKCMPEEVFQVTAEFKAYLQHCKIPFSAVQEPKTRMALEFFSANPG